MEVNNMKAMGKASIALFLMLIVSLFLTSCSSGGLVTPELQLVSEEDLDKLEETEEIIEEVAEEEQATGTEGQTVEELIEELIEETVEEIIEEEQIEETAEEIETEEIEVEVVEEVEIEEIVETASFYLNVPYEKYAGANWCLPASSAMTFKYFGFNISQAKIASVVIEDGSSSVFRMIKYARDLGFEANYSYMTIEEIKNSLKKNIPVIAVQNYSLTLPYSHARVIIGFNDQNQEMISNDPTAGKDYEIDYSVFRALSLASDPNLCKVIVISPKGKGIDTENIIAENNTNNS
jgi:ribosome-binding factor A